MVGQAGEAGHDRVSHHRHRCADRRARKWRSRSHGHRARRQQVLTRKGYCGNGNSSGRRAEFPSHHDQRNRRDSERLKVRQALAMAIDRAAIARAMLGPLGSRPRPSVITSSCATRPATETIQAKSVSTTRPARRNYWTRQGGSSTARCERRAAARSEINCVIPAAVATSRQESELIQNMLARSARG